MRVAYLTSQYPASSHTFIRREVMALRAQGVDVSTFSVRRPSDAERAGDAERAAYEETFYILPAAPLKLLGAHLSALLTRPGAYLATFALALRHRVPGVRAFFYALFYFAEAILLGRELQRRKIQHLHNHFANAAANVGLLAARFADLPWSLTLHAHSETDYPAGVLLADKVKAATFAACVSHFMRAQVLRVVTPEHWQKPVLVRCGLDLQALPPARAPDASNPRPRVICVARLDPEKGQVGLVRAFAQVRKAGVDAELVLVGDGHERVHIEATVRELGLTGDVTLLGRLPEADTLREIARSDLLVLPSFMEGVPVSLMEAMALGVPVIAARVAGVPELVEHEREGMLFSAANWDELQACLERMLRDPELRARQAKAARAKIEAEFEIHAAVRPLAARWS